MKTTNLILTLFMLMGTVTNVFSQANTPTPTNWLNSFSFSEYLLMSLCTVMLVVIWLLARTIKSLTEQMR